MDFTKLKRNASVIAKAVMDDEKAHLYIAKAPVDIYFPKHYVDGKLGSMDDKFNPVGIFAIVSGDSYAVHNVSAFFPLTPSATTILKIDEVDYYKLSWQPGEVICPNTLLVMKKNLAFEVFNEFVDKGRVPPYFNKTDFNEVTMNFDIYCGVNLDSDASIISGYGADTLRDPKDLTRPLRELYRTQDDMENMQGVRVPLSSIAFNADNTSARLFGGSYFGDGTMSALVNRSEEPQVMEQVLFS